MFPFHLTLETVDYSIMFFMYDPNKIYCENLLFLIGIVLRNDFKFHLG